MTTLLAIPNVSEGRDAEAIWAIADAFTSTGAKLLDVHSDEDHHRTVYTLAGGPGELAPALAEGATEAIERIDLREPRGQHPHVGAIDVAPVVHLDDARRGAACAEALLAADLLGELGLPVYLYGALAGGRTRAELRRAGALDSIAPDFGPAERDPRSGAVLVAARPPLVAFNVTIEGDVELAKAIARELRAELDVRALGLRLTDGVQVSTNIEDHTRVTAADVVNAVKKHARVTGAELVAPAPRAALENFPHDVPLRGPAPLEDQLPS